MSHNKSKLGLFYFMKFSVLLSVYHKESPEYLVEAIKSIWDLQTLKPDQIVLVEDGPLTESLYTQIYKLKKEIGETLTVIPLSKNIGLSGALNEGLKYCKHDLVARMDTDDVALPDRFEKQLKFMLDNPDVSVCSGQIEEWNQNLSQKISERSLPLDHDSILKFAKTRSPISHPAAMFKKSCVLAVGGYPEIYPEDYQLWGTMLTKGYRFANMPDLLLRMRVGNALVERRGAKFLKGILRTYRNLYGAGFLTRFEFLYAVAFRALVLLSPVWLKSFFYKNLR
jgi:glycosyltransferase involved in cell wall biosynthesis